MPENSVLIVGSSGHAKVVIDIFERVGEYEVVGLVDDYRAIGEETLGYEVLGKIVDIGELSAAYGAPAVFVAVGDNWARYKIVERVRAALPEVIFATAVHPSAAIAREVSIGAGVAVMAGSVVNTGARIGDFAYLNTRSSADHDAKIGPFASLGPGVTLGGNVTLGAYAIIGIGASAKEKVRIGEHGLVGAGAVLLTDCPPRTVMFGVPARIVRGRTAGERYL